MLNSDRFLNAFGRIEIELRKITNTETGVKVKFWDLLQRARSKSSVVARNFEEIRSLSSIRNFLIHELDKKDSVLPTDDTVQLIEKIADILSNPPMVNTIFQTNIFTCNISDRIDSVLAVMRETSYSQVPVYNNGEFWGLLTTNTISRWLAEQLNTNGIVDNENIIDKVMKYEEFSDNYKFIDRHKNLFDVTELFRIHLRYTSKLDAVLITETGNINQRILAIITWYDLPNIYRIMLD